MPKASVKIMLSYDYSHFEICLSTDEDITLKQVNEMRKDAQRLADNAVRQYKKAKSLAIEDYQKKYQRDALLQDVDVIRQKPLSEWTPEEKAKVKLIDDKEWQSQFEYDYDDDEDLF